MPHKIFSDSRLGKVDFVILVGGEGKRLKSVVNDRPKPMAQIGERPFLDILISHFNQWGFKRFILCICHFADIIEDYYRNKKLDYEVIFVREKEPLGTGGAIKNAESFIKSDTFFALNGDSFCPLDLSAFYDFHLKKQAKLSIVVNKVEDTRECGTVILDDTKQIVEFKEKTDCKEGLINTGIYSFKRKLLELIPAQRKYSLEYEFFPKMIGDKFYGFFTEAKLLDIGTPNRLEEARKFFRE